MERIIYSLSGLKIKRLISIFIFIAFQLKAQVQPINLYNHMLPYILNENVKIYENGSQIFYDLNDGAANIEAYCSILNSWIELYKTTKDKAYLVKFVEKCIELMEVRYDKQPRVILGYNNNHPIWTSFRQRIDNSDDNNWQAARYVDGRLIYPMAEFVYMALYNGSPYKTEFSTTYMPAPSASSKIVSNTFGIDFSTMTIESFALWLSWKARQTINFILSTAWHPQKGLCRLDNSETTRADNPLCPNMQSTFAASLLLIGIVENISDYINKAGQVAQNYKSKVSGGWYNGKDFLELNTAFNSYYWNHVGIDFSYYSCKHIEQPEDILHAQATLIFPRVVYNVGKPWFSSDDMIRFHNTFTRNIYSGSPTHPLTGYFWANVKGGNDEIWDKGGCDHFYPNAATRFDHLAITYMPFEQFDVWSGSQDNAYNIIMNYYDDVLAPMDSRLHPTFTERIIKEGPALFCLGLAEVAAAQWRRECPDLLLCNRLMVYNQDFYSKHNIIVNPSLTNPFDIIDSRRSFAEPIITDPVFLVKSGVSVNMTAANEIELLPGFETEVGAKFETFIEPNLCNSSNIRKSNNSITENTSNDKSEYSVINEQHESRQTKDSSLNISIASKVIFEVLQETDASTIRVVSQKSGVVRVYNMVGFLITEKEIEAGVSENIDLSSHPKGLYLCKFYTNAEVVTIKIIIK